MARMTRHLARLSLLFIAGLSVCASPALADVIRLKDGKRIEGDIKRTEDGWAVTGRDGRRMVVPFDQVAGMEATGKAGPGDVEAGLASLRRAVEHAADLKQVIDRYKTFIAQHEGTPVAEKARADLGVWQERFDRGMVKVGERWVTAQEKADLQHKAAALARDVAEMLRQGRLREATPVLEKAVADNPQSAALWYLKGVLHYRQDQFQPARKAFESALPPAPDHAPTLNNLAVVLGRLNAHPKPPRPTAASWTIWPRPSTRCRRSTATAT
jgi:tetratricopeptide (TPR) repeat protein